MLLIFPSGTFYCFTNACGINFWGVHGHDGIWHLAIANVSFQKFPFIAPTYAGQSLYGYNYLFDFFTYLVSRIGLSSIFIYFKLFPVIWFIIFTVLLIVLARKINNSSLFVAIFLFFNYFAGSFYYLIKLYREGNINDSSTQLPQPVMLMMSNPPYAFSLLFLLLLLVFIKSRRINVRTSFLIGCTVFIIMGLKFYGGAISIFLIGIYVTLAYLLKDLKRYLVGILLVGLFTALSVIFFYNPAQSLQSGSIFGFAPFALVHTITEMPNQFYLQDLTDARYYLVEHGVGPRLIGIEALNLIIFLFFYLGTRFFGLLYVFFLFLQRKLDLFDFSLILTICFSILLTVTLVQKAEWWNTIQFFYYAIFLTTIYLARLTYSLITAKKILFKLIAILILVLSIPTSYDMIKFYLTTPGATYLPKEELEALNFLKKEPDGIVLTHLYKNEWKNLPNPKPLYAYEDTAYVAAFSHKQEYFANELQLRLTGVAYEKRLEKLRRMDCSILKEVNYVYEIRQMRDEDKLVVKCNPSNIKTIYRNKKIIIYAVL